MAPKPPLPPALLLGRDLTLTRGGRTLFAGLTVHLSAGDVLAVEGPNGAGKSSLLLTLAGVLHAEAGAVTTEVGDAPSLHFLGYGAAVKTRLTVAENLRFWAAVYGGAVPPRTVIPVLDPATQPNGLGAKASAGLRVKPGDDGPVGMDDGSVGVAHAPVGVVGAPVGAARDAFGVSEALERVGLGGLDNIEAGHLSAGQTKRLGLARLLVSKRLVWLLDEPTASLDTAGDLLVQAMLDEHARAGGAAIVATHDPLSITHRVLKLGAIS